MFSLQLAGMSEQNSTPPQVHTCYLQSISAPYAAYLLPAYQSRSFLFAVTNWGWGVGPAPTFHG